MMARLAYLQITRDCNQDCVFCSNPKTQASISLDECLELLRLFKAQGNDGVFLTGGEPTLCDFLPSLIAHSVNMGLETRIITNGQKAACAVYLDTLVTAGLSHLHLSVYSHIPEVQDRLTNTQGSLERTLACLDNCQHKGLRLDVNITINALNQTNLHETVAYLCRRNPNLGHFVFNFMDTSGPRVRARPEFVPSLPIMEPWLMKALNYLDALGKTFRVERVPLCYMAEYAHCSTECRKLVKEEARSIHFLDQRGTVTQSNFFHSKTACCTVCSYEKICAGLFDMDNAYPSSALYPLFLDPQKVRQQILEPS